MTGSLLDKPVDNGACVVCGQTTHQVAPVQGDPWVKRANGTICWQEHLEVWRAYDARFGCGQSAERVAERAGFSYVEIVELIGHAPRSWQAKP